MKTKEQWTDEIMESLEGIRPAHGDPFIYQKVMEKINHPGNGNFVWQPRILWQVAAGLAFLITFNVFSVLVYTRSADTGQSQVKTLASEYFSYIESIKL